MLFAAAATSVNILLQRITLSVVHVRFALPFAMMVGTAAGLLLKYILDKRYIFIYKPVRKSDDLLTFTLYSLMGVVTTGVFWITELFFNYVFHFEEAKYLGALVGLIVGYSFKYYLDKRFVFRHSKKDEKPN